MKTENMFIVLFAMVISHLFEWHLFRFLNRRQILQYFWKNEIIDKLIHKKSKHFKNVLYFTSSSTQLT